MSADKYGKAIEVLANIVSDENQPQSEKDAAIEIAANLNYLYNHDNGGDTCFYCGEDHPGVAGVSCNGGQGWD